MKDNIIFLTHCKDRCGLSAAICQCIADQGGNILHFDQHVDEETGTFFARAEWEMGPSGVNTASLENLQQRFGMEASLHRSSQRPRIALFVSKAAHCLHDILSRHSAGELPIDIPLVVSNHEDLRPVALSYGIDYFHFPKSRENKEEIEVKELKLLDHLSIDTVVLARYMQILTSRFVSRYPQGIINIHHSFLPAFPGARPYHSAFSKGVKIIGATSHYVTEELDQGPIIEQDVTRVTHKDCVSDFIRKGRDLEKIVLSRALWYHCKRRILTYNNKTIVFL